MHRRSLPHPSAVIPISLFARFPQLEPTATAHATDLDGPAAEHLASAVAEGARVPPDRAELIQGAEVALQLPSFLSVLSGSRVTSQEDRIQLGNGDARALRNEGLRALGSQGTSEMNRPATVKFRDDPRPESQISTMSSELNAGFSSCAT
jgi:hypothetical protein